MPLFGMAGCCCAGGEVPPNGENCCLEYPIRLQITGVTLIFEDEFEVCDESLIDQMNAVLGDEYILDTVGKVGDICRFQISDSVAFTAGTNQISLGLVLDLSDFSGGAYHTADLRMAVVYSSTGGSDGTSIHFGFDVDEVLPCDGATTLIHTTGPGGAGCFDFDLSSPTAAIEFIVPP